MELQPAAILPWAEWIVLHVDDDFCAGLFDPAECSRRKEDGFIKKNDLRAGILNMLEESPIDVPHRRRDGIAQAHSLDEAMTAQKVRYVKGLNGMSQSLECIYPEFRGAVDLKIGDVAQAIGAQRRHPEMLCVVSHATMVQR